MNNFMEIVSKIVREHVEDINNNNFAPVYSDSKNKIPAYELTRLFMIAGINPPDALRAVPAYHAQRLRSGKVKDRAGVRDNLQQGRKEKYPACYYDKQ